MSKLNAERKTYIGRIARHHDHAPSTCKPDFGAFTLVSNHRRRKNVFGDAVPMFLDRQCGCETQAFADSRSTSQKRPKTFCNNWTGLDFADVREATDDQF